MNAPHPSARINITEPTALAEADRQVAAVEAEQRQERERYKLALLAMLEQALDIEAIEEVCHKLQWPLERQAVDKATAARAVINHCKRIIAAQRAIEADPKADPYARKEAHRIIALNAQVRDRWMQHLVAEVRA